MFLWDLGFNLMMGVGGDISVHFGWSFLGEWRGRGTILITLYLPWGLARGCRGSSGSGWVSVRWEGGRQGVSHLQPMCLTGSSVREQIPLMILCSQDHSNMFVCKELPEISLP